MANDKALKKGAIEEVTRARKDVSKEKKPREISTRELIRWFKFYVLPIISIAMLLVVIVVGIYPNVKGLFDYLDQIDELRDQSRELDARIEKLKGLAQADSRTEAYLGIIDTIVPEKETEVVNFQEKIKNLGNSNDLRLVEAKAGETIIIPEELGEGDNPGVVLIEVPSQFSFQGNLDNIKKFLTELNKGEDFLVINEMKLTSIDSVIANQWTLDIIFVKYQFQELTESQDSVFTAVSESSEPNRDVLDFIRVKYGEGDPLLNF